MNIEGWEILFFFEICIYKYVIIKLDCFEVILYVLIVQKIRKDYDFVRVIYFDDFDILIFCIEFYGGQVGIDGRYGSCGSDYVL